MRVGSGGWLASFVLVAGLLGPTAVLAAVDATVEQALALQRQGRAAQAYALLVPLTGERAGDPDFDFALGMAAVDTRRPAEAIIAFQRVLAVQPGNAQARAELARAYAVAGDADTARREFDTVARDPTLPDPVRQRFTRILGDMDRTLAGGGTDVTGFVEGGLGHDSNVNSATDLNSLVIPLFAGLGAANLSAGAVEQSDEFARAEAGISVVHGLSRQTRLFGSVLGSTRANFNEDDFTQATLTGTAGVGHTFANRVTLAGSLQAQNFWLGGEDYRRTFGGTVQATRPVANGAALSLSGQVFDIDYPNDGLRDADRWAVGGSYAWRRGVVAAQTGKEETKSSVASHFSHDFAGASVFLEAPVAQRVAITATAAFEKREYGAADPLFLRVRDDDQVDLSAGLRIRVGTNLMVRPQVTYTRNQSNIALYDYDRTTVAITVRAEF